MIRRALVAAVLVLAALPLHAGFSEVVRTVEARTGLHQTSIPLVGLARFAVWIVRPAGVHDFQLATFENAGVTVEPAGLDRILAQQAGRGFQPLVATRSRARGEWTYIYARPSGERLLELILATHDSTDTVVLRAVVDADEFLAHVDKPDGVVRLARN